MVEELKTLKNFYEKKLYTYTQLKQGKFDTKRCLLNDLKQELGIKWIEELSNSDKADRFVVKIEDSKVSQEAIDFGILLLKTIFNIKKEDLKL